MYGPSWAGPMLLNACSLLMGLEVKPRPTLFISHMPVCAKFVGPGLAFKHLQIQACP